MIVFRQSLIEACAQSCHAGLAPRPENAVRAAEEGRLFYLYIEGELDRLVEVAPAANHAKVLQATVARVAKGLAVWKSEAVILQGGKLS